LIGALAEKVVPFLFSMRELAITLSGASATPS
jgi:hypothetical protein